MEEKEFNKKVKKGEVKEIKVKDQEEKKDRPGIDTDFRVEDYHAEIRSLKRLARYTSSAPSVSPRGILKQFDFYESGGAYRLYAYIKDSWKKVFDSVQWDELVGSGVTTLHKHDIIEDTIPQLGGDLDLNGKNIDFPSVANISDCKDEDDMASDSPTMLATQQSIKKFVEDNSGLGSYTVGNTLLIGDSFEVKNAVVAPTWTLVGEVEIDRGGTLRIKFDLKIGAGGSGSEATGRIYRNGSPVGTSQTDDSSETYETHSEDIAGWTKGDLVQLYSITSNGSYSADTRNFEIYVADDEDYEDRKPIMTTNSASAHWAALSMDSIYKAGTNGLVVVKAEPDGPAGRVEGYTDGNNPPTTLRCNDFLQEAYHTHGGFTMPVKKGDYFEVNDDNDNANVALWWFPLEI